jgi:aminomethyltransferase
VKLRDDVRAPRRTGWRLGGKRVPREGYAVLAGEETVGHVTSGTFSPTLDAPIAMGYVRPDLAAPHSAVMIDIRGTRVPAQAVSLPFYKRTS